jgi:STE24 endopeptidase
MSRFLLLLVFMGWMSGSSPTKEFSPHDLVLPGYFLCGYIVLILATAALIRRLADRVDGTNFNNSLKLYNRIMGAARLLVPAWFFVGTNFLGWGPLINGEFARLGLHPARYDTPGLLIGCLPAVLTWVALWWAQYPADICFREQGLLSQLDAGLPIHRPPSLRSYFKINLRLQLFFTIGPVLALVLLRDLLAAGLRPLGLDEEKSAVIQLSISLITAAIVLIFAPELLRRLIQTEPMPAGVIREKLESICRRHNIRYKDVLLWRTDNNMGNAAVMGLIPQVRYILMSDLLLETMTDDQIEAVFAHEVGHVIHRHMLWFAVFFGTMMLAIVGMSGPLDDLLSRWFPSIAVESTWSSAIDLIGGVLTMAGLFALFLYLSRRFERQADVFAARWLEEGGSHVGLRGATIFSSALEQVARINCIPVTAWSWCHGSIANRIEYLHDLSEHPDRTLRFDRFMAWLYGILIVALCGSGACAIVALATQK